MKNLKKIRRQNLKNVKGGLGGPSLILYPTDENGYCSNPPYISYCARLDGCMTPESWDKYCA
ncbi:bacteriocin-like protein [Chryseobacterium kwangjuense]|uniref:Bacteriocin-like protein n=1 Tax=Chryseobacterium kwangjuense TaxID=267125 RepID=A0ABW9JZB2_9FLAO